jgi:hypothetical protein
VKRIFVLYIKLFDYTLTILTRYLQEPTTNPESSATKSPISNYQTTKALSKFLTNDFSCNCSTEEFPSSRKSNYQVPRPNGKKRTKGIIPEYQKLSINKISTNWKCQMKFIVFAFTVTTNNYVSQV